LAQILDLGRVVSTPTVAYLKTARRLCDAAFKELRAPTFGGHRLYGPPWVPCRDREEEARDE
jgi:hypothetical protein